MDTKPGNPLAKHFRQPAIYFKLPTKGRYWPEGSLELPVNGEMPIYPMTTADEVILKTPDALMNGSGIVSVIQSCCPSIKDAWKMPSVDVDAVLIAIRIASYGQKMDITSVCPACGEEHDYEVDLSILSGQTKCPDFDTPVVYQDLKIKLRPQEYFSVTQTNITNFEEQRIVQAMNDSNIDEDVKNARIKESVKRILDLNDKLLVDSTEYIEMTDGTRVTDPKFIAEFYRNAESRVTRAIQERSEQISKDGALPLFNLVCAECQHEFKVPLEFDYAHFFDLGS